jgi:hypothetical protein
MAQQVSGCGNALNKKGKLWQVMALLAGKMCVRWLKSALARAKVAEKWQARGNCAELPPNRFD